MKLLWAFCVLLTVGCAHTRHNEWSETASENLVVRNDAGLPYIEQGRDQCGPAALMMVLQDKGIHTSFAELVAGTMTPAIEGSTTLDLSGALRRMDLMPVKVDTLQQTRELSRNGHLPVLLINIGHSFIPQWHYVIITGYDGTQNLFHLRSGTFRHMTMSAGELAERWNPNQRWGIVVLKPNEAPVAVSQREYLREALTLERMKKNQAANQAYHSAWKKWPLSKLSHVGLTNTYVSLHQLKEAEEILHHARLLFPTDQRLAFNLTKIRDFRRARPHE